MTSTADDLLRRALRYFHKPDCINVLAEDIQAYLDAPKDEPVYLARRKGLDDFFTCSKDRYEELSVLDLFETKLAYLHPPTKTAPKKMNEEINKAIKELLGYGHSFVAIAIELGGPVGSDKHNELINYLINHYDIPAAPMKPMTREEILAGLEGWDWHPDRDAGFYAGIRFAERHHGITGEGKDGN